MVVGALAWLGASTSSPPLPFSPCSPKPSGPPPPPPPLLLLLLLELLGKVTSHVLILER